MTKAFQIYNAHLVAPFKYVEVFSHSVLVFLYLEKPILFNPFWERFVLLRAWYST